MAISLRLAVIDLARNHISEESVRRVMVEDSLNDLSSQATGDKIANHLIREIFPLIADYLKSSVEARKIQNRLITPRSFTTLLLELVENKLKEMRAAPAAFQERQFQPV